MTNKEHEIQKALGTEKKCTACGKFRPTNELEYMQAFRSGSFYAVCIHCIKSVLEWK